MIHARPFQFERCYDLDFNLRCHPAKPPARAGGRAGGSLCKGGRYSRSCTTPKGAAGASSSALRPPLTIKPERRWPRSLPRAP